MPHKYEREIEEILRNIESTEPPRRSLNDRVRVFQQRPRPQKRRSTPVRLHLSGPETLLVAGIALAMIAAGIAFLRGGGGILSGGIAVAAFVVVVLAFVSSWREGSSSSGSSGGVGRGRMASTMSRGSIVDAKPTRLRQRRGPISQLMTQFRIVRLKLRYWRSRER